MEPSSSSPAAGEGRRAPEVRRVRRQALEAALEQVQRAIEMLRDADPDPDPAEGAAEAPPERAGCKGGATGGGGGDGDGAASSPSSRAGDTECETAQLCDLLKSKVESLEFLQKLDGIQKSVYQNGAVEPDTSWDVIKSVDLWKDDESDDGYVLVNQEDVVDGITSFMAAYLLSLNKKTKELSPIQLQKALQKTFSAQKRKSKIRKTWDGTKVVYNVASWGATAVGVYNNRALIAVATTAIRTPCRVISKFL